MHFTTLPTYFFLRWRFGVVFTYLNISYSHSFRYIQISQLSFLNAFIAYAFPSWLITTITTTLPSRILLMPTTMPATTTTVMLLLDLVEVLLATTLGIPTGLVGPVGVLVATHTVLVGSAWASRVVTVRLVDSVLVVWLDSVDTECIRMLECMDREVMEWTIYLTIIALWISITTLGRTWMWVWTNLVVLSVSIWTILGVHNLHNSILMAT